MMKTYSFAVTPQSVVLQRDDGYAFLTPDISYKSYKPFIS